MTAQHSRGPRNGRKTGRVEARLAAELTFKLRPPLNAGAEADPDADPGPDLSLEQVRKSYDRNRLARAANAAGGTLATPNDALELRAWRRRRPWP